jgi:3-hydroxyisobutyrate dehydrogenase-like beta-hydroxyacid dehydrogenase
MERVGFIGLGLMGAPMAANVVRAGYLLTVYNRTLSKCDPLQNLGARVAASPREVAEASDVVITMLSNAAAVEQTVFGQDGVIAARLAAQGVGMLDAPVIGSTGPAQDGTLGIMVGGDKKVFEAHEDLLEVMGKDLYFMGSQGSGAQMKLSMNLLVAGQLASLCEALLMAAKAGLDMNVAGQIITTSNLASNLLVRKVPAILQKNFQPGFPLKHLQKDLGLIVRTAESVGAPIYATSAIHQLYLAAKEKGYSEKDASSLYQFLAEMAGLKP